MTRTYVLFMFLQKSKQSQSRQMIIRCLFSKRAFMTFSFFILLDFILVMKQNPFISSRKNKRPNSPAYAHSRTPTLKPLRRPPIAPKSSDWKTILSKCLFELRGSTVNGRNCLCLTMETNTAKNITSLIDFCARV